MKRGHLNINSSNYDLTKLHRLNTPFFSFASPRRRRGHGHKKVSKRLSINEISNVINKLYEYDELYAERELYVYLRSLSRHTLQMSLENLEGICSNHPSKLFTVRRILLSYGSKFIKPPRYKKESYVYCSIPYIHNAVEKIGIREILKHRDLNAFLPHAARQVKIRTTFSYGPTIGKKLFNYNKTLKELTNEDLCLGNCECNTEYKAFNYSPHGHVHTGNLDIIQNAALRGIMTKGAKFRLTPTVSMAKIWYSLEKSLLTLKRKISKYCKMKEACLDFWYDLLMKKVKKRFHSIRKSDLGSNDIFGQESVIDYLKELHKKFVIVPVDKASNNFAIICKQFYIQILKKELGIEDEDRINGNVVYQPCKFTIEEFFLQQELENKKVGNTLEDENYNIPLLYWTSKQHKSPYKFHFIAGASHSTNKTISIEVALALRCIKTHFKNYCKVIRKNSGYNYFWSIENSIEFIKNASNIQKADTIETFDFSTLYTNLPLDSIYTNLELLIIKMYKNSGSVSILVNADRRKAFWSQNCSRSGYKEYTIDGLLAALKFVLYNTYVRFGNNIFLQIQGIPMGGNASPFIADLYLAWDEFCTMDKLVKSKNKSDNDLAKCLSNNSRYIDDISVINFLGFDSIAKRIYHPSLILEGSEFGYHYDTFLDLSIRIHKEQFVIGIYHKVDDFDFEVINFAFPNSNIESMTVYKSFYSQLVRFYTLCNNIYDFCIRVDLLRSKLCFRGFKEDIFHKYFLRFCKRYPAASKYSCHCNELLWSKTYIQYKSYNVADQLAVSTTIQPCSIIL